MAVAREPVAKTRTREEHAQDNSPVIPYFEIGSEV